MEKIILTLFLTLTLYGQTIKDISNIVGIRENQLIGNGLVVGLKEGDGSKLTEKILENLMTNAFIQDTSFDASSSAAVIVTATLPAFAKQGDKIKVDVSSIAGATALDGGQLLLTQLKGIDGKVYAIAQGRVIGLRAYSGSTNRNDRDASPSGYIYDGAMVENELSFDLKNEKIITLSLIKQDAKVAFMIEDEINKKYGKKLAVAYDTRTIEVTKPEDKSMIRFISEIQSVKIDTMIKNKIIIDSRREIIVAGADITINPVTISRNNFTIRIKKSDLSDKAWEDPAANPGLDAGDDTKVESIVGNEDPAVPAVDIDNALVNTKAQPTVSDLMRAMKMMKLGITEIIETIKMLDNLGAINAEVEMVK